MTFINLLIVDDHPVFRQGLRDVFETDSQLNVVGETADGEEAIQKIRELRPNVVLMDIHLPSMNGLQVTRLIKTELPATQIIMISGYDEAEQIYYSISAGASAFCSKDLPPESLIRTVHSVMDGNFAINEQVFTAQEMDNWLASRQHRLWSKSLDMDSGLEKPLSPREMEILDLICQGSSNKEIAQKLGISYQTVKNHVTAILQKLGVSDRTQAVLFALKNGWFQIES